MEYPFLSAISLQVRDYHALFAFIEYNRAKFAPNHFGKGGAQ